MTDNLIKFRYEQNKSIVEFASTLGISYDVYYKIEAGKRKPSYNFLCKFKNAYPNANIDNIFFTNLLDELSKS